MPVLEKLKSVKTPNRDSALGRAIATGLQVLIAVVVFLPVLGAILADERFVGLISDYLPQLAAATSSASAVVTFVNNLLRKNIPKY